MNGPEGKAGLLFFLAILAFGTRLHVNNLATIVGAAVGAYAVRQFQFLALSAHFQRRRLQVIVSPAAIAAAL